VIVAAGTFQKRYMHSPFAKFTLLQNKYKHNGICCGLFSAAFEFDFDIGTVQSRKTYTLDNIYFTLILVLSVCVFCRLSPNVSGLEG
jgi:hypothetical protein